LNDHVASKVLHLASRRRAPFLFNSGLFLRMPLFKTSTRETTPSKQLSAENHRTQSAVIVSEACGPAIVHDALNISRTHGKGKMT
jgi:hypothetical protein